MNDMPHQHDFSDPMTLAGCNPLAGGDSYYHDREPGDPCPAFDAARWMYDYSSSSGSPSNMSFKASWASRRESYGPDQSVQSV